MYANLIEWDLYTHLGYKYHPLLSMDYNSTVLQVVWYTISTKLPKKDGFQGLIHRKIGLEK